MVRKLTQKQAGKKTIRKQFPFPALLSPNIFFLGTNNKIFQVCSQNVFFHAHDIEPSLPGAPRVATFPYNTWLAVWFLAGLPRRVLFFFFYHLILEVFLSFSAFIVMSFQCATTLTNTDTCSFSLSFIPFQNTTLHHANFCQNTHGQDHHA